MKFSFDPDRLRARFESAAHDLVERKIREAVEPLQCEEHGTRATVAVREGNVVISGYQYCDAFEARVASTLKEKGARPRVQPEAAPTEAPKVFMSHSHADKERIVNRLDELLRERGLQVWLDTRDLLPGTNIVDEIFSHGIGKSNIVIVVLSANSIDSRWVHEELTNAVVQKIKGVVKMIIPMVLDGVTPPDFLLQTVYEPIPDPSNLAIHADRIAASVFGQRPAPTAPPPAYAGMPVHRLPSLSATDEQLFVAACKHTLDTKDFYDPSVQFSRLFDWAKTIGLSEEQVAESIRALEQHRYFARVLRSGAGYPVAGRLSHYGFEQYLKNYDAPAYREAKRAVIAYLVNNGGGQSDVISNATQTHPAIVEHIAEDLKRGGHIIALEQAVGMSIQAEPTLARVLRDLEAGK
jgi:TIR domain